MELQSRKIAPQHERENIETGSLAPLAEGLQDEAAVVLPLLRVRQRAPVTSTNGTSPSYAAESNNKGLSPLFGESLDYISITAFVTDNDGLLGIVTGDFLPVARFVDTSQPFGQSPSRARQQSFLSGVWLRPTTQTNRPGWSALRRLRLKDHVAAFDLGEILQ